MGEQGADRPLDVAVVGSGVAGLSCAWLLSQRHRVTLYEDAPRLGGHAHTVEAPTPNGAVAVDTGFIVYNDATYPNLAALFGHLGVPTTQTEMSFGVSLDDGRLEYGSAHPLALFAQPTNLASPRFWSMLADLVRFYRSAPKALEQGHRTLGELLDAGRYGAAFQEDHLLPQVGAIWSMSSREARDYPAEALVRFFQNHGLLNLARRPPWRTVRGGSRAYVERLAAPLAGRIRTGAPVERVVRAGDGVSVRERGGRTETFDRVVIAAHADQALAMLDAPTPAERRVLGAFRYSRNRAVLHDDPALMPRRRAAWSAWNHIGRRGDEAGFCVSYWMNELQDLPGAQDLFVTLNPCREVAPDRVIGAYDYEHPLFDAAALEAQKALWSLQGEGGVWFCGAHFGAGFHEDGLQAGLAVAEQLGGVRRPWQVAGESDRIHLGRAAAPATAAPAPVAPAPVAPAPADKGFADCAVYSGWVGHTRLRPRRHALRYRVFMLLLDLDQVAAADRGLRWFSAGRFNLTAFHAGDHGDGSATPLRTQVERLLEAEGLPSDGGPIRLLCLPRILGYVFNPISVYFCHRRDGTLAATVYEVSSTFGERHSYVVPAGDGRVRQSARKRLHVSPFLGMDLDYGFRVAPPGERVEILIDALDAEGEILRASFVARREPLSDATLAKAFLRHPLLTLKVVAAIHWEAVKLLAKGLRLRAGPPAPVPAHSRGSLDVAQAVTRR